MREATLNHEIARLSRQVTFPHQDPADRFIAATAIHYNLTLGTVDHNLLNIPGLSVIS
jgi:PIN domain nuclease of toxin-antitoxin system